MLILKYDLQNFHQNWGCKKKRYNVYKYVFKMVILLCFKSIGLGALTCIPYMQQALKYNAHTVEKNCHRALYTQSLLALFYDDGTVKCYKTHLLRYNAEFTGTTIIIKTSNSVQSFEEEKLLNLNCSLYVVTTVHMWMNVSNICLYICTYVAYCCNFCSIRKVH